MAKRLGLMTGTVYDEDADVCKIQECCVVYMGEELDSPAHLDALRKRWHLKCDACSEQAECAVRNNCVNIDAHLLQVL